MQGKSNAVIKLPPNPPPTGVNKRKKVQKYSTGMVVRCDSAASRFYEKGRSYTVTERNGKYGLIGSDGLFDSFEDLISVFKEVHCKIPKEQLKNDFNT